ncbi:hypothetical protein L3X38_018229 [Prunus dulcis]|uniref:Uncharacterized protein n=1 Tax=Prunus dulcis TaxID=3755 RepID=A0AAD4WBD3_PRUDU|nr:hypothetical protein L3X38_018229 [Prunus dulcis]
MATIPFTSIAHPCININPLLLNLSWFVCSHNLKLAAACKTRPQQSLCLLITITTTVATTSILILHAASDDSNPKLHRAFLALQAWKRVIYSDPYNFTSTWVGTFSL